jgi:ABC-2 type transport system ATP-binding protein
MEATVEFVNVSKSYKKVQALDDVSFNIPQGSVFGYIGPNGAGKTTTIKILVGLISDFTGEVYVNGADISSDRTKVLDGFGYLPQEVGFQEWRTIRHMMTTFGRLSGLPKANLDERIEEVLELAGLPDSIDRKIVNLSGGMQQKLRFAQSLLHNPKLLVLDEPLSGLDPASRHQVKAIIRELSSEGVTVFFSSHILSDVQDIASLIGILSNGRLMKIADPEQLQSAEDAIELVVAEGSPPCQSLDDIQGVERVEVTSSTSNVIHLRKGVDVDIVMRNVLQTLVTQNCHVRSLRLLMTSLEDVYLKYVRGDNE